MNTSSGVPPGFRFSPTDEELVDYYLRRKVSCRSRIDNLHVIKDIDLYKIEPWDLQELCRIGTGEQSEWYFFSHRDKKYPTGTRTNRATAAGFWKATGRDKAIYANGDLIGMRKTLVFYKGRAPNGQKSDWIMHEYRLQADDEHGTTPQEEGWVVCRVFTKPLAKNNIRKVSDDHDSPIWYDDHHQHQFSLLPELDSPKQISQPSNLTTSTHDDHHHPYPCNKEPDHLHYHSISHGHHLFGLPLLDGSKLLQTPPAIDGRILLNRGSCTLQSSLSSQQDEQIQRVNEQQILNSIHGGNYHSEPAVRDWRVLDKLVASQLSGQEETAPQNASASSTPTCQTALWK